jgi:flagellin-like hook-associated protein FlgL
MINSVNKEEFELSYDEINNIFNPYNYDGMYVLNTSGDVLSAYNRKDGIIIDNKIISDDDISNRKEQTEEFNIQLINFLLNPEIKNTIIKKLSSAKYMLPSVKVALD